MNDRTERGIPKYLVLSATLIFLLLSILTVLLYIDYGFKHPAEEQDTPSLAFFPANMPLALYSPNFPAVWSDIKGTPSGRAFLEKTAQPVQQVAATIRRNLGVRITPFRWRAWYGSELLFGSDGINWFVCTRPGLLPRLAERFLDSPENANGTDAAIIYRVWKDELLFLGSDRTFLEKTASQPRSEIARSEKNTPILIRTSHGINGSVRFSDDRTILIVLTEGISATSAMESQRPGAQLFTKLPGYPILHIFLPEISRLRGLFAQLPQTSPDINPLLILYSSLLRSWRLDAFTSQEGPLQGPVNIGLYGLNLENGVPLPKVGLWARTTVPILRELQSSGAFADPTSFVWNSHQGWMLPLLGQNFALYGCDLDKGTILASTEELASRLVASSFSEDSGELSNYDFMASFNFKTGTPCLEELFRWAFGHNLVAGMNESDFDSYVKPYFEGISQIGAVNLSGKLDNNQDGFRLDLGVRLDVFQGDGQP